MKSPDLAQQITGRPLTRENLQWIERHIATASAPFARFLSLLLLLHAYKSAQSRRREK